MNLAIIPARSGSTRIKDKNVIDFCGRPMLSYPLQAARESGLFDTIHVSTDSERYAQIARGLGHPVDFLRDDTVSANDVGMIDVLRWVVREYARRGRTFETVCLVYATAALVEAEDLRRGHDIFVRNGRTTPVLAVTSYPAPVQRALAVNARGLLDPLYPDDWKRHSQTLTPAFHDAGSFFFIDAKQLVESTVAVFSEFLPCVLPRHHVVDIDEPEDLEMAETLCLGRQARRGGGGRGGAGG